MQYAINAVKYWIFFIQLVGIETKITAVLCLDLILSVINQ